jgi:hypothetical protein
VAVIFNREYFSRKERIYQRLGDFEEHKLFLYGRQI